MPQSRVFASCLALSSSLNKYLSHDLGQKDIHDPEAAVCNMNQAQERLQREGRACYKRQRYAQALDHFSRAIGRAPSVSLLDNRAACHEKLDDLPAALKDAKKAMQLTREDPTGYLRAGKVLVKMEKPSVALEIYSHGLKSVKHAGQGYEVLLPARVPHP